MLSNQELQSCLFLDIETVSTTPRYEDMSERMQMLWDRKASHIQMGKTDKTPSEMYEERAGIYAEFGKIICISCGFMNQDETGNWQLRMRSYANTDEKSLLESFADMLRKSSFKKLCAHNGKEFDFPYLSRRMLILGIKIPEILNLQGKKPWESGHLDTMELWKFGDFKAYTSLDLLSAVFDIPTPKDDINGADVGRVFWKENGLDRIREYCEKDVLTTCQVLLRMMGRNTLSPENIINT